MQKGLSDSPLGQQSKYISTYSPELLFPIPRQQSRSALSITAGNLPFYGVDIWTGYELSWLNERGKPVVALAEFQIPHNSEFIVESKSFKLYLNSFNQSRFESTTAVQDAITGDLSSAVGLPVVVKLEGYPSKTFAELSEMQGECLDGLDVEINTYHPEPALLCCNANEYVAENLVSHLLKSNCPVTGQPDWASVQVCYAGKKIDHAGLLSYIISFREHQDFHEHCVERMFIDIMTRCAPEKLSVYARYTRRGGLDINPFRTSEKGDLPPSMRLLRQ